MIVCFASICRWPEVMECVILLRLGLMWCGAPIFSPLLDYWDLMELRMAEFAPAAFHITLTHCGVPPSMRLHSTSVRCCLQCAKKGNGTKLTVFHEWMRQRHLERCPGQEMLILFLLSWAEVTFMIDRQMMELHNEPVAYFSQKGSHCSWWPNGAGKRMDKMCFSSKRSSEL